MRYREMHNFNKDAVRRAQQESWNSFIPSFENDIHTKQKVACMLMCQLNKSKRDTARLNITDEQGTWARHYQELWTEREGETTGAENYKLNLDVK